MRLYLLIHYDGTPFSGSQAQYGISCRTVQGELWQALDALNLKSHVKRLHFASRTDQGVHAQGQVAELDVSDDFLGRVPDLSLALNAKLPPEIAVTEVLEAGLPDERGYYPSVQFDLQMAAGSDSSSASSSQCDVDSSTVQCGTNARRRPEFCGGTYVFLL